MKRRSLLWGTAALAGVGLTGAALWKPGDLGGPHNTYFSTLNKLLKRNGPGRPVMILDLDRTNRNIDSLTAGIRAPKTYRVVVKSLPSLPLLKHTMQRAGTNALMVFHQPFLNTVAEELPESDVLLGKPLPVNAVRTYYRKQKNTGFDSASQVQWLIDTPERLDEYLQLARELGVHMRLNFELDVGLHRGGLIDHAVLDNMLQTIEDNAVHLGFGGFMGYEPHLAGVATEYTDPALQQVLGVYRAFMERARLKGQNIENLTLNGAGSHTIRLYQKDNLLNDLSAGSGLVKPSDFDTANLTEQVPSLFIATPILKKYDSLKIPGEGMTNDALARLLPTWDPNTQKLYFLYGGYWKANIVSPPGAQDWLYHSTNQSPVMTSDSVDLAVNDYMFLRPTQSEHVMLQFGDLLVLEGGELSRQWPVFHQTG